MDNANKYSNYFPNGSPVMQANKRFMILVYTKYPWLGQPYRFLSRHVPNSATILDLGAGQGNYLLIARQLKPQATFYVCDIENALSYEDLIDIPFSKCDFDVEALPYDDNTFDHINCLHVLEHLKNPIFFIKECYRILKPGGTLYLETPDVRLTFVPHIPFLTSTEGILNFWDDPTHIRPYSCPSLRKVTSMSFFKKTVSCFYVHRWAHILALPLAIVARSNDYKSATFHALGFFCAIIVKKIACSALRTPLLAIDYKWIFG